MALFTSVCAKSKKGGDYVTMKHIERRSFLQAALALSALPCVARTLTPSNETERPQGGQTGQGAQRQFFAVAPGASRPGKSIRLGERHVSVKVSGDDNNGGFALFEVPAGPESGPPLHMHHVENECFYVLEGELKVQVGTELFHLEPGGSIYAPSMIPHTWQTVGEKPARFLSFAEPAGHVEAFLVEFSNLLRQGPPTPAGLKALFENYDMEMVGPPLPGDGVNIHTTR